MKEKTQKLVELCAWLEPKVREVGWHVAATGSALYGHPGAEEREPDDLDIVLFRHSGYNGTLWRPFDVLLHAGLRKIQDCTEYPEFMEGGRRESKRQVFRWIAPSGTKIDFLCLEASI